MKLRLFVLLLSIALVGVACGGGEPLERAEPDAGETTEDDAGAAPDDPSAVEVFHHLTAGGEADALEALLEVFHDEYPDYRFEDAAVAGGAGTNVRAVLASRLSANDAPSSFQGMAGQELIGTYVAGDQLEPLNFLFEEQGWLDVLPEALIEQISDDGNIYSVPVNIHRANVMWYLPERLAEWGVDTPTTWGEFFSVADELEAQGVTPLALGEQWTVLHLLEAAMLSAMGPEAYDGLWDGTTDWGGEEMTESLELFDRLLEYTNSDAASLSWDQAAQLVADGDAAFTIMGDWASGFFASLDMVPGEGYGWVTVPDTDGSFQWLSDSFVLPVGAHNREGAIAFLMTVGSKAGQDAFNPIKGSIPARQDADRSLYDEYLISSMQDWENDVVVPSLAHGAAASDAWKSEIETTMGIYLSDGDLEGFQAGLVDACSSVGRC